ncbi:MAG: M28 family peptidase [Planctomycetes bacterium]|nr:M28 family peptidase [Planctomycetota bacterium]
MRRAGLCAAAAFALVAAATVVATRELRAPAPVPASAPAECFSAERALAHVRVLAARPHPVGSEEHARVRAYLVECFQELGLEVDVQEASVALQASARSVLAAAVQNVVARLAGTRPGGKAVALVAHYDSAATGPGAADDASGVAVLLETARALRASAPLPNDVLFVVTDAEEVGLLGACAFLREHPLAARVGAVLNFEARGQRGPAIMFETSGEDAALIEALAAVAPDPLASSLASAIYGAMPNDTDLTVFKEQGIPGLNFAFIGGLCSYHSMLDRPDLLAPGSVQHQGGAALALARRLGAADLAQAPRGRSVYFSVLRAFVVRYPAALARPLCALSALALLLALFAGVRRRWIAWGAVLVGFLAVLVAAALSVLLAFLVRELFCGAGAPASRARWILLDHGDLLAAGLLLLVVALCSLVFSRARGLCKVEGLWCGALLWWAALALASGVFLPEGAYVFSWPLLFAAAGLGLLVLRPRNRSFGPAQGVLVCLAILPGIVLVTPLLGMLHQALTLEAAWLLVAAAVLLLGLLAPLLALMTAPRRWPLCGGAAVAGFLVLLGAALRTDVDARHPRRDSALYCLDADAGRAFFATLDQELNDWSVQFHASEPRLRTLEEVLPFLHAECLVSAAPVATLPAAQFDLEELVETPEERSCVLRLLAPPGTRSVFLSIAAGVPARLLEVDGKEVLRAGAGAGAPRRETAAGVALRFVAPPAAGVLLKLVFRTKEPVEAVTVVTSDGLPELPGAEWAPRPEDVMPYPNVPDSVHVKRTFQL